MHALSHLCYYSKPPYESNISCFKLSQIKMRAAIVLAQRFSVFLSYYAKKIQPQLSTILVMSIKTKLYLQQLIKLMSVHINEAKLKSNFS